jgi:hypothetical protein
MGLDSLKYLHVASRTFQVTSDALVLIDKWGVREWRISGIESELDTLLTAETDRKILKNGSHKLDWQDHSGTGSPSAAQYYIDGAGLGGGENGLAELKRVIAKMPEGSTVTIVRCDEGKQPYPFNKPGMERYCRKHGVSLEATESR